MTTEAETGTEGEQVSPDREALARVAGEPVHDLPQDLYIPPDALEVFLDAFEGPLDLLLYLIRRQNMDILDVDVSAITDQYIDYIALMEAMRFELAAEYLVMAATLAEIKSRMLLPRQTEEEEEEHDPRAELIRRLQEYERYKMAAEDIDALPRRDRDFHLAGAKPPEMPERQVHPDVSLREMLLALRGVLERADLYEHHQVEREQLSTRERMASILDQLSGDSFVRFETLFSPEEGRLGVVVSFIATLELIREQLVEVVQSEPLAPLHIRARGSA
ncbi:MULTISPECIES: segregation and condensation protein A [Gammaproteobacteria]|uniref:Segregation and condensation protein A n=1 Tax=Vreelandella halophila TaxID=86177 RepID=A0A9X4YDV3_9GAMM|nr:MULTISPECIES: ScpA family protein [Gammaproteobacteria]KAA8981885.1 segregation/condensation protein A [Halospina sp. K52047b]MYL27453.1 segregation/condensation protein A [Halomonas utahensis]MYL74579.1 segregation/condensation protein A [Halomonas sp. 22501_18_FS]